MRARSATHVGAPLHRQNNNNSNQRENDTVEQSPSPSTSPTPSGVSGRNSPNCLNAPNGNSNSRNGVLRWHRRSTSLTDRIPFHHSSPDHDRNSATSTFSFESSDYDDYDVEEGEEDGTIATNTPVSRSKLKSKILHSRSFDRFSRMKQKLKNWFACQTQETSDHEHFVDVVAGTDKETDQQQQQGTTKQKSQPIPFLKSRSKKHLPLSSPDTTTSSSAPEEKKRHNWRRYFGTDDSKSQHSASSNSLKSNSSTTSATTVLHSNANSSSSNNNTTTTINDLTTTTDFTASPLSVCDGTDNIDDSPSRGGGGEPLHPDITVTIPSPTLPGSPTVSGSPTDSDAALSPTSASTTASTTITLTPASPSITTTPTSTNGNTSNTNGTKHEKSPTSKKKGQIRWTNANLIGHGTAGKVYLGMDLGTGELVAVKKVQLPTATKEEEIENLEREINMMKKLQHPHIVRYIGAERKKDYFVIFLEYVPGGSIASLLKKFGKFEESVVQLYTRQILQGLQYLHENGILHRDIKGANCLVDVAGHVKLADFGSSKSLTDVSSRKSITGTPNYMSRETIVKGQYTAGSDIWSVGCTVIEMLTGRPPWSELGLHDPIALLFRIANSNEPPPLPKNISDNCRDFLRICFQSNPADRGSVKQLLEHPFIAASEETGDDSEDVVYHGVAGDEDENSWGMTHRDNTTTSMNSTLSSLHRSAVFNSNSSSPTKRKQQQQHQQNYRDQQQQQQQCGTMSTTTTYFDDTIATESDDEDGDDADSEEEEDEQRLSDSELDMIPKLVIPTTTTTNTNTGSALPSHEVQQQQQKVATITPATMEKDSRPPIQQQQEMPSAAPLSPRTDENNNSDDEVFETDTLL